MSFASAAGDNQIEIIVAAQDQASEIVQKIKTGVSGIGLAAKEVQVQMVALTEVTRRLGTVGLSGVLQLSGVLREIRGVVTSDLGQTVFGQIKAQAEQALAETQSLSSVLKGISSVGQTASAGFFGLKKADVLDGLDQKFAGASAKFSNGLINGVVKVAPALERYIAPLDQKLSEVVVDGVIRSKIPGPLNSIADKFGVNLSGAVASGLRNTPIKGVLGGAVGQAVGGSLLGAVQAKITQSLTNSFSTAFVAVNSTATQQAFTIGQAIALNLGKGVSKEAQSGFDVLDAELDGVFSNFLDNKLPLVSKGVAKALDVKSATRNVAGELTNGIVGGALAGNAAGFVGGQVAGAIGAQAAVSGTQLLKVDVAAGNGLKTLTGGALVELGGQLADVTRLTDVAEKKFETLFTGFASTTIKRVAGGLVSNLFGTIDAQIPPQLKQVFAIIEARYPQQIGGLKEKIKSSIKGVFEGLTVSPVEQLQRQVAGLQGVANLPTVSPAQAQALTDQLQRFSAAEKAKEQIAGLKQELLELQGAPIQLKGLFDQIDADQAIAPAKKDALKNRLVEQITEAEAALKSPIERLKEEIAELEDVANSFDFSAVQNINPQEIQQIAEALNDVGDVDRAKAEIEGYKQELESLKNLPTELNNTLKEIQLNPDISQGEKDGLAKFYTQQIDEAQDALISRTPEIKAQIAELQKFLDENYTDAQKQGTDALFSQKLETRTEGQAQPTQPIDIDAFEKADAARTKLVGLRAELEKLQNAPSVLKEELVKVQIDTQLDPAEKDKLAAALTEDIKRAEAVLENPVDRIKNQIRELQAIAQNAPDANFNPTQAVADVQQFNTVEGAKAEVAALQSQIDELQNKPIELQAQIAAVNLDASLSNTEKDALTRRLSKELNDAEAAIKSPVDRLALKIANIFQGTPGTVAPENTVFAKVAGQIINVSGLAEKAQKSVDGLLKVFGTSVEELSTSTSGRLEKQISTLRGAIASPGSTGEGQTAQVDTSAAQQQLANLEAQLKQIRSRPLEIKEQIVKVNLDPEISDADKQALIGQLVGELQQAQGELQAPLAALAESINNALGGEAIRIDTSGVLVDLDTIATQVDAFFENVFSDSFTQLGTNAGQALAKGLGSGLAARLAPIADQVDGFILSTINKIQSIPQQLTQPLEAVTQGAGAIAGLSEPTELFNAIREGAGGAFSAIASVGEQITFFSSGLSTLQSLVTNGPFELLIGQNIKLREQILSTQASLVSTNNVVDGFNGNALVTGTAQGGEDQTAANLRAQFEAIKGPVKSAIDDIRKGSLELSGVTSGQLIDGFNIIATQAGNIGLSLKQSSQLTLSFAAALGTLGVPLDQARQEISSILQGQITSDSVVAKSLGITNEQVRLYKQQGTLFEKLTERLQAFRTGNKLAAETVAGYTSNIQEAFEMIALKAGEPLLDPITKELGNIYNYVVSNQDAITASVSEIAQKLFNGVMAAYNAIKYLISSSQGFLTQIPEYLFGSLANFLTQLGTAITNTVNIIQPVLSVIGQVAQIVQPLSGPILQITLQAKVLSTAIGGLSQAFGFLSNVLPGVGEFMFGINVRMLPMINMFPALTTSVGQGAAGFLLLGKHMQDIPGVAGAVQSALSGVLGPIGPLVAGFVPQIAGIGITVLGVAKNFPVLQSGIDKLFAAKPDDLIRSIAALTGNVPGLSLFKGLLEETADKVGVMARGASLAEFATAKFQEAVKLAAIQLRNFVVSSALLAAGLYLAFTAVDTFILKNQALMETLRNIGEGIVNVVGTLGQLAQSPFFVGFAASVAIGVIAATNLHIALLRVIGTQIASWATGAATALARFAGLVNLIGLGSMAQGATQASTGLRALAIALTQGTGASAQFLAANGTSVVSLDLLKAKLFESIAGFRAFIASTISSAVAMGRNFVGSLIAAGTALVQNLISAIPRAIAGLIAMRASAGGTSFSFVGLATSIRATSAAMLTGIVSAARGVIGFLVAAATGAGTGAVAFGTLTTAIYSTIVGFATLLAPIALVVAAIAAVGAGVQAFRVSESTKQVQEFGEATDKAFGESLAVAQRLKSARTAQDERTKNGIKLTQEEYAANQKLQQQANEKISNLDKQIAKLQTAKKEAVGEANKGNIDSQIAELERAKKLLTTLSTDIKIAPKDLPEVGSAFQQLTDKAQTAEEAIKNAAGDPEIFKKKTQELVEITEQQLKQGQITASEARRRLSLISSNTKVEADLQIKAQEAISETFKTESQKQVEAKQAASEKIQADIATGKLKEVEGERQLSQLKNQELTSQLDASKATLAEKLKILDAEETATKDKLNKELESRKAALEKIPATARDSKEGVNATKAVEDQQQKITDTEAAFADQRKQISEKLGNEQIKLQAQIDKNTAESAAKVRDAELKALDEAQKKAQSTVKQAANARVIQQQQLAKQGLAGDADIANAKAESAKRSAELELQAEQEKIAKLEQLAKTAPTAKAAKDIETQIRESRLKTQDLTMKSLEAEQGAYDSHINQIKAGIERQQTAEEAALQKRLNTGDIGQPEIEAERAQNTVDRLEKEVQLETRNKDKRLKLELDLEKAKTALREAGVNERRAQLDREATAEETALQRKLNAGEVDSSDIDKAKADRKVADLQKELQLESTNKDKRLKLELELEQAKASARAAGLAERKNQLEQEADLEELAAQRKFNAGGIGEAQLNKVRADLKVKQLADEAQAETVDKGKRAKLELELEQAKYSAKQAGVEERKALLEREANQEQTILQKQINSGTKRKEDADVVGKQLRVKQLQEELQLEQSNADKRAQLELQLEQAKGDLIDSQTAQRKAKLEEANKTYQNQIEAQNQALQRQSQLYEALDKALENRNKLFKAAQDLSKAGTDFATGELDVLSKGERSEFRKRQLAEITAAIKLEGLKKQQEYERQSLALDEQKNKLALEREIIANRIAQSQQKAAIASAKAEVEIANADPKTTKAQRDALQLKLQAEVDKGTSLGQQGELLQQQGAINDKVAAAERQKQSFQQRLQLRQAQGELAENLPPGLRAAANRNLQQQIAQDFGANNYQDLRNRGLVKSRTLAAEQFPGFGNRQTVGSAVAPELEGMQSVLNPQQFAAAQAAASREAFAKFDPSLSAPAAVSRIPAGTQPLQVPQALPLPTGEFTTLGVRLEGSGKLFSDSVDRLIDAIQKQGGQTFQINVTNTAGQKSSSTVNTNSSTQITVEDVIKVAKQLAAQ